jgi:hypothetical protein
MKYVPILVWRRNDSGRIWLFCELLLPICRLFSLVAIFAHQFLGEQSFPVRQAAWYTKALPTFSDTLADRHVSTYGLCLGPACRLPMPIWLPFRVPCLNAWLTHSPLPARERQKPLTYPSLVCSSPNSSVWGQYLLPSSVLPPFHHNAFAPTLLEIQIWIKPSLGMALLYEDPCIESIQQALKHASLQKKRPISTLALSKSGLATVSRCNCFSTMPGPTILTVWRI